MAEGNVSPEIAQEASPKEVADARVLAEVFGPKKTEAEPVVPEEAVSDDPATSTTTESSEAAEAAVVEQMATEPAVETPKAEETQPSKVVQADAGKEDATPKDELTQLKEQNAALLARLNKMAEASLGMEQQVAAPEPVQAPAVPAVPAGAEADFVSDDEFTELFTDAKSLNKILNKVRNQVRQEAMLQMTAMTSQAVVPEIRRQMVAMDFYRQNPELVEHRPLVAHFASEVQAQNPGFSMEQTLEVVVKEINKLRAKGIPGAPAMQAVAPRAAFAPTRSVRPPTKGASTGQTRQQELLQSILNKV